MKTRRDFEAEPRNERPADDTEYEAYVREAVAEGERAAARGETVPHDEVMREARENLRRHRHSLKELLEGVEDGNLHPEVPTGKAVGDEIT
jgi:hypothetical protein